MAARGATAAGQGTHPEVMRYCTQEVLERNAFHGSMEAVKSVADRLRAMTGVVGDGARLVDNTLTPRQRTRPRAAINDFLSTTDRDEQNGFANLCKELFSMFRNPVAHDPRIKRKVTDDEFLETLTVASLIHRRLDVAVVGP